jgi:hypothetical protein
MLPIGVEFELWAWDDVTNVILGCMTGAFLLLALRKSNDETWIRKNTAHVLSLFMLVWTAVLILSPFIAIGVRHPDLIWEIGSFTIHQASLVIGLTIFTIIVLQIAQYLGFFKKREEHMLQISEQK